MDTIQLTATFPAIAPDDLTRFKELAGQAIEKVRSEPGCLQYDWFFSGDGTRCVVRETYADSDAVLAHMGNVGDILQEIVPLGGGLEVDVFGSPSAELAEAAAAFAPTVYPYFDGT